MVKFGIFRNINTTVGWQRPATFLSSPHKWPSGCLDMRILGPRSLVHLRKRIPCAFGTRPKQCVLKQGNHGPGPSTRRHRKFFSECTHSKRWNLELWLGRWCDPRNAVKAEMALMLYMFILWRQRCFLHIDQRESPLHKNTSLSVSLYPLELSALDFYLFELRWRQNHAAVFSLCGPLSQGSTSFGVLTSSVRIDTTWRTVMQTLATFHTDTYVKVSPYSYLNS